MTATHLYGKTLDELKEICDSLQFPSFTAKQIAHWLYVNNAGTISEMTNLSAAIREKLSVTYDLGLISPVNAQTSSDGTKKYLFPTHQGKMIESAYIPDKERATLCVSSQVGCKLGCRFCMTGMQGFQGNLTANEILNQVRSLPELRKLTNLVYMGMGEPFDNLREVIKSLQILTSSWGYAWSPKRITVSTVGIIPGMREFIEKSKCHLAVSLHSPFDEERLKIMPVQKAYPIKEVIAELKKYDFGLQRRISFEYIVFKNLNDSPAHSKELARLLKGLDCRVNLIRFHTIPGSSFEGVGEKEMEAFRDALNNHSITATVRASRGQDIYAACGLLSTLNKG